MKGKPRFGTQGQTRAGDGGKGTKPHFGTAGQPKSTQNKPCSPHYGDKGQEGAGGTASGSSKDDRR